MVCAHLPHLVRRRLRTRSAARRLARLQAPPLPRYRHGAGGDSAAGGLWQALSFIVSLGLLTALFAMAVQMVPRHRRQLARRLAGRRAYRGAVRSRQAADRLVRRLRQLRDDIRAAASIIVLLIWVYYSAQILLIGAEFTHAFASETGTRRRQGPGRDHAAQDRYRSESLDREDELLLAHRRE